MVDAFALTEGATVESWDPGVNECEPVDRLWVAEELELVNEVEMGVELESKDESALAAELGETKELEAVDEDEGEGTTTNGLETAAAPAEGVFELSVESTVVVLYVDVKW